MMSRKQLLRLKGLIQKDMATGHCDVSPTFMISLINVVVAADGLRRHMGALQVPPGRVVRCHTVPEDPAACRFEHAYDTARNRV